MAKQLNKIRNVYIPVIDFRVHYFLGDILKFKNKVVSLYDVDIDHTIDDKGICYGNVIWVADGKDFLTILHETVHVVDNILDTMQCLEARELRAYLIEFLMSKWV